MVPHHTTGFCSPSVMPSVMVNPCQRLNIVYLFIVFSFVQLAPGVPVSAKELTALEHVNPGGSKPVSRFAPSILVKFSWDHDAEVCTLQFVHGRITSHFHYWKLLGYKYAEIPVEARAPYTTFSYYYLYLCIHRTILFNSLPVHAPGHRP
jgi:hypothetical protein